MASIGQKRPGVKRGQPVEPRLFLIRIEEEGKQPTYVMAERTALVETPNGDADDFGRAMYRKIDELFAERSKAVRPSLAIGIPAELDPRGGGYVVYASSMGNGDQN